MFKFGVLLFEAYTELNQDRLFSSFFFYSFLLLLGLSFVIINWCCLLPLPQIVLTNMVIYGFF